MWWSDIVPAEGPWDWLPDRCLAAVTLASTLYGSPWDAPGGHAHGPNGPARGHAAPLAGLSRVRRWEWT
ncbi:hypothetical protein GCM10018783_00840 [Streptomyces griseosporeus]|nr:hypothetical protein GCM10018783_00840 [Streptomyces griseosporeus]